MNNKRTHRQLKLELSGIVIIVGAYGSGKTEVSINLAVHMNAAGTAVRLADLDLVNPYFRTREARHLLHRLGIDLVLPPAQYMQADLPILTPEVSGMLRHPSGLTLLDVGGDDVGATVLAALADPLAGQSVQVLQVINPNRPYTDTVDGCLKIRREIEAKAKMTVTGIIGNANLMEDTTEQDILEGYNFSRQVARAGNVPLAFITSPVGLLTRLDKKDIQCPVLALKRQLVPPWKQAETLGDPD
ncbi:cobalamin biosynthesis protein CbiA [Desulfosarcina alkanivorans]|uniref:cobalamin biosynthesis protein CbiA n=1 Tax=Desulfosarcina alkanivorans TaxID=571177 RepID=UPI001E509DA3|nr:cobalamin biosynthesis protein CbiA [Desulfosarcina alkanivorans]